MTHTHLIVGGRVERQFVVIRIRGEARTVGAANIALMREDRVASEEALGGGDGAEDEWRR